MIILDSSLKTPHSPVLYREVNDTFKDIDGYIIDCTVGYGGHSEALLLQNENVKLICIDQDSEAIEFSKKRLAKFGERVIFAQGRFSKVIENFKNYNIKGILADIGVSSLQLDKKDRGFGFDSQNLDMRMDTRQEFNAQILINNYSQSELERVFREFGEVRNFANIASMIVTARLKNQIMGSKPLTEILKPKITSNKVLALIFQAIRIEVNDELGELTRLLESIKDFKFKDCKVAIISFHSLEDRIVKNSFRDWTKNCICPPEIFQCECGNNNRLGKILTKKPIIPTSSEIRENRRSRSSKMRIFKFN